MNTLNCLQTKDNDVDSGTSFREWVSFSLFQMLSVHLLGSPGLLVSGIQYESNIVGSSGKQCSFDCVLCAISEQLAHQGKKQ